MKKLLICLVSVLLTLLTFVPLCACGATPPAGSYKMEDYFIGDDDASLAELMSDEIPTEDDGWVLIGALAPVRITKISGTAYYFADYTKDKLTSLEWGAVPSTLRTEFCVNNVTFSKNEDFVFDFELTPASANERPGYQHSLRDGFLEAGENTSLIRSGSGYVHFAIRNLVIEFTPA